MKKKTKRLLAGFGCAGMSVLGVILGGFLGGFLGIQVLYFVTAKPYSDSPGDRAKLRAIQSLNLSISQSPNLLIS